MADFIIRSVTALPDQTVSGLLLSKSCLQPGPDLPHSSSQQPPSSVISTLLYKINQSWSLLIQDHCLTLPSEYLDLNQLHHGGHYTSYLTHQSLAFQLLKTPLGVALRFHWMIHGKHLAWPWHWDRCPMMSADGGDNQQYPFHH